MFHYNNGVEIKVGDVVLTGNKKPGRVIMLIHPGSKEAEDYSAPGGGILVEEDWGAASSLLLVTPPGTPEWDDLTYIRRRS